MKLLRSILCFLMLAWVRAQAESVLPLTTDQHVRLADAVFRGTVLKSVYFTNSAGQIFTRTALRVDEVFKGKFPAVVNVVHRGGVIGRVGMTDDSSPRFRPGEERLLFLSRRDDGTLFAMLGDASALRLQRDKAGAFSREHQDLLNHVRALAGPGADVTGQTALPDGSTSAPSGDNSGPSLDGLLLDGSNNPWRYTAPDRGETIPYLVDADLLPAGITLTQALGAVSNATKAWMAASSVKFVFLGVQSFGQASANINTNDGIVRIQLHDKYGYINAANILGKGGSYDEGALPGLTWGPGGQVGGQEFSVGACGFVVLEHTNSVMSTLSTFTEVLTHELGHVMGLAHSSNVTTNDPILTNSIMYYLAHADGRGASLNSYDTNVVRELHPLNPPPYSYNRVMDVTQSPSVPNVAGINEIQLSGFSLQATNLTLITTNASNLNGTFSVSNTEVQYIPPAGYFYDTPREDPAGNGYYDYITGRFTDGTNASAYVTATVVSLTFDSGIPSDGIPDYWMTNYFGHAAPSAGDKSRATDDADGDGLDNLQEYIAGTSPIDKTSAQRITSVAPGTLQWQAKAYELYEILGSTNLTNWARIGNPILPTNAPLSVRTSLPAITITATVSNLPGTNVHMFYRVEKVP